MIAWFLFALCVLSWMGSSHQSPRGSYMRDERFPFDVSRDYEAHELDKVQQDYPDYPFPYFTPSEAK